MSAASAESELAVAPATDRRRLRTERGRELVVDALLEFYDEGDAQPGAAKIAARAGVSERTVFRYFDDLESLVAAAVERQIARIAPTFAPPDSTGSVTERVAALVEQRERIYAATAVTTRAALVFAPQSPTVAHALAFRRDLLRDQVAHLFAPELATRPTRVRNELLDALDAATGMETLGMLRSVAGHSPARTRAIVTRTVRALLSA
jgi:AcrR family transcriptional regulator